MKRGIFLVWGLVLTHAATGWGQTQPAPTTQATSGPAQACTVLRMAVSKDGLTFKEKGEEIAGQASAPSLAMLPNGRLLLMYDREDVGGWSLLVVSQSADGGLHWSPAQPVMMEQTGSRPLPVPGRHGAFVWTKEGLLRLYFIAGGTSSRKDTDGHRPATTQPFGETMLLSAVSRDGINYKPDRKMGMIFSTKADLHVTSVQLPAGLHLFVDMIRSEISKQSKQLPAAAHLFSKDGQRFEKAESVELDGAHFVGGIVAGKRQLRAYVTAKDGIRSLVSKDGKKWEPEKGLRVAGGWDPAAVQLKDGSCVMVYCTAGTGERAQAKGLTGTMAAPDAGRWEPFAPEQAEVVLAPREGGEGESAGEGGGESVADSGDDFNPPTPDLKTPVDYLGWLQQRNPVNVENNAWDAYATFMPVPPYSFDDYPNFPGEINDMFNSEYSGPIISWDPEQYSDWEATHNAMQGLLGQFREATQYEQYVAPLTDYLREDPPPDSEQPLFNFLLPSMAFFRAMTKATLADAWRAENGVVDKAKMVDAFETCLRNSNHMEQGITPVNHLVGWAEQAMVESNALIALQRNVFTSPEQIETALDTLQQYDQYDSSAVTWLPMVHASALDTMQYLYQQGDDGRPHLNPERAEYFLRNYNKVYGGPQMSEQETQEYVQTRMDAYSKLSPEEVRQSVETIDSYFRQLREQWQTGYPQVREMDIKGLLDDARSQNVLVQDAIPDLSRLYHLFSRNEASRRATQLTYEVHLFKARNGRWPSSLDELPVRQDDNNRIDPFTGGDFGYQLGENGPLIYTAGEDGQDNGGAYSEWHGEGKDYVFWPQQK